MLRTVALVLTLCVIGAACSVSGGSSADSGVTNPTSVETLSTTASTDVLDPYVVVGPPQFVTWDWYLTGGEVPKHDAQLVDLDGFDTPAGVVAELHEQGVYVVCYISAGTVEDWRPDVDRFSPEIVGNAWAEWEGERYLDISNLDLLGPVLTDRISMCAEKGFDAVEADNVDVYGADTGFDLTSDDSVALVRWLAQVAHEQDLAFALKNTPEIAAEVAPHVDFAITEDCLADGWCEDMQPFAERGLTILAAEYTDALGSLSPEDCTAADELGLSLTLFHRDLGGETFETCN